MVCDRKIAKFFDVFGAGKDVMVADCILKLIL